MGKFRVRWRFGEIMSSASLSNSSKQAIFEGMRAIFQLRIGFVLTLLLLSKVWVTAQVSGYVIDAENGDSLPFAYILNPSTKKGCFSGLDGRFSLDVNPNGDSIRVNLLGYLPQQVFLKADEQVRISLVPGGVNVQTVLITPTENPALRILRNVIDNRYKNNPQQLADYSCESYNKLSARQDYPSQIPDSKRISPYIFLSETVTQRLQVRQGKVQEKILSARLAGYPGKVIPFTAGDLQDLSFYTNYIAVFGQPFLNPASNPGMQNYQISLIDTVLSGADSIFTIHFEPGKTTFDGFAGELRVQSGTWALLTVDADLVISEASILLKGGHIRQIYTQLPDGHWVPSQLNTEIKTKALSKNAPVGFLFSGFSSFSNHRIGEAAIKGFRSEDVLVVSETAGREDSLLNSGRSMPLDSLDKLTYRRLDSLGRAFGLNRVFDQTWKISDGKLMLGPVDLILDRLLTNNRVEKTRIGFGLSTNNKLSKRFELGIFAGWGIADKQAKWGASLQVTPFGDDRLYFGVARSHDLVESGFRRLGIRPERGLQQNIYKEFGIRNWYLKDMEYVDTREIWLGARLPSDLGLRIGRRLETSLNGYGARFDGDSSYRFDEAEVLLRWAPGAQYATSAGKRLLLSNKAPVVMARFTRGLATDRGDFEYNGLAFAMKHNFNAFRGGKGAIQLFAGGNDRPLPRSRMRVYRSNFAKGNFSELPGAFNTMRYDEFTSDLYAEAFLYLSPRLRWLHFGKRIQPRLNLSMAAAWGKLYPTSNDRANPFEMMAPSNFYLEPGLVITHLLPAPRTDNMIVSLIRSIGFGAYYRVGAYSFPDIKQNFAFRISFGRM